MRQHIDLYVNNYSLQLGPDGKAAVNTFYGYLRAIEESSSSRQRNLFSNYGVINMVQPLLKYRDYTVGIEPGA